MILRPVYIVLLALTLMAPFLLVTPALATSDVDGYVYDTDGVTGVEGATVTFRNITTGAMASSVYEASGGRYYAYFTPGLQAGNVVEVIASKNNFVGKTQVTVPDPARFPVPFSITLAPPIPAFGAFGGILLSLSIVGSAIYVIRRRSRRP